MDGLWAKALVLVFTEVLACLSVACRESSSSRLEGVAREKGKTIPVGLVDLLENAFQVSRALTLVLVGLCWVWWLPGLLSKYDLLWSKGLVVLAAAAVTVFLFDMLPSAIVQMGPEYIIFAFRKVLVLLCVITRPFVGLSRKLETVARRVAGVTEEESEERVDDEILEAVSAGEREGYIGEEERQMIEGVIEFHDIQVREVMTPRIDIVTIEGGASLKDAADIIVKKGHSRIPVYEDNRDNIIGILYEKDLLAHIFKKGEFQGTVADCQRKPYFIPEAKSISLLLKEMRAHQMHIAIVLDEYGGTSGLVTIEDLLEEIVGEIEDEYDEANGMPPIRRISADAVEVGGKYHIDNLNKVLNIELPEDGDFDTIGGFVSSEMGRIPRIGERLETDGVRVIVLDADDRKVKRLRVETISD